MSELFLTGATGFVGMEVLARVLERSDRQVAVLVRAPDQASAGERIDEVLVQLFGGEAFSYADRVEAVPGDVTSPGLGLDPQTRARLGERTDVILHCAASVSFDLPLEQARAINVEGTRRVLELAHEATARGAGVKRLIHVSTAYVAGTYQGCFREGDLDVGQSFRNTYERSKFEAECLVAETAGPLPVAIARPSIVVGERDSGWTAAFNVLYWPLRAFARGMYEIVPARPGSKIDVVPVDYVADGIFALLDGADPAWEPGNAYHLAAGRHATTVAELTELAASHFGREPPDVVPPERFGRAIADRELSAVQTEALRQSSPYLPYLSIRGSFDNRRARALLESKGVRAPRISEYFERLMSFAHAARWGKRRLTRPEARAQTSKAQRKARHGA
jgi:long-chain acyl-CoA synthetase